MLEVSRRGLLVLGGTGAAGVALAACGQGPDQRDDASPDDLTAAEASAETALAGAYGAAASALPKGQERTTLQQFATAAGKRADELGAGTEQTGDTPPADGGPDSPELAAVDHFAGNEQAPSPFVTGATAAPYEAADTSTTSTTSTSTTSTGSG